MREAEALRFMSEVVRPVQTLILERNSAPVSELRQQLLKVLDEVHRLPNNLSWPDSFEYVSRYRDFCARISDSWPELGPYNAESGVGITSDLPMEVADAIDDLADIANDFENGLLMAREDASGALSLLRFNAEIHWGEHVEALARHLSWLSSSGKT